MLAKTAFLDFGIQFAVFLYSAYHRTEKLYDVTGSLTFHACLYQILFTRKELKPRQLLTAGAMLLWATRLGSYLFLRVQSHPDKRFDKIKNSPVRFLVAWMMQGVWVFVTSWPTYLVLLNERQPELNTLDFAGVAMWITGFLLEAAADYQKYQFKKKQPDDFVSTGVWRYSQYPNYFGEILLWIGNAVLCFNGLDGSTSQYLSLSSPVLIAMLIINVSGVRLSQKSQQKKYGHRKDYQQYVANTSKYVPWFPSKSKTE
ncbi:hypothetical protein EDD86DRAFT_264340 [Gorgonomyces haynaldii]|nr:hypothetical protein EDD86DRAFT_264340 [Gorgonomyces haynaldii]